MGKPLGRPWYDSPSEFEAALAERYGVKLPVNPWGLEDFQVFASDWGSISVYCLRCDGWSADPPGDYKATFAELIDLVQPHTKECKGG